MERDEVSVKWAKSFWKGVRGKYRGAVARHKKRMRAEQRRLRLQQEAQRELALEQEDQRALVAGVEADVPPLEMNHDHDRVLQGQDVINGEIVDGEMLPHEGNGHIAEGEYMQDENDLMSFENEEDEAVMLVQGKVSWVKFLQDDMEYLKAQGEHIGAYVAQLQSLLQPEATHDSEAFDMVQALLAAYAAEPTDEARPDRADNFARKWWERLRVLLQRPRVSVVDTQQHDLDEQAQVLEQVYGEASERRLDSAQRAQAEDDQATKEALQMSGSTTRPTAETSSSGTTMDVMVRRVLVNGVQVPFGEHVAITGQRLELAVQMGVCILPNGERGRGSEESPRLTSRVQAREDDRQGEGLSGKLSSTCEAAGKVEGGNGDDGEGQGGELGEPVKKQRRGSEGQPGGSEGVEGIEKMA